MLRRNLASEFVAGAYVFPGGSVDPEDHGPQVEALCRGRSDADASAVLGVEFDAGANAAAPGPAIAPGLAAPCGVIGASS